VTLNLTDTSVVKSRPSVPHGANLIYLLFFLFMTPVFARVQRLNHRSDFDAV